MGACIFCGADLLLKRAKEHIIPKWAIEAFGLRSEIITPTHFSRNGKILSSRKHTLGGFVSGHVCQSCNAGWMSDLEQANMGVIQSLAHGIRSIESLLEPEKQPLAMWAAKTAYALHAGSNYRMIIPASHFHHLAKKPESLPESVCVIGANIPGGKGFSWAQTPSWTIYQGDRNVSKLEIEALKRNSYKIAIRLGELLLLIASQEVLAARRALIWGVHIPLYPRKGPVTWIHQKTDDLRTLDPQVQMYAILTGYGLSTKSSQ